MHRCACVILIVFATVFSMTWYKIINMQRYQAVRVRALAGDTVLCSWARHFTLTVPHSTQVYKWGLANLVLGGNPAMD